MIKLNQINKRYPGGFEALSHVTFSVDPGEMVFLTGHSGAGKSTLIKLISVLERPTSGQIVINGQSLTTLKKSQMAAYRLSLGVIFQTPHLLQDHTIFENVALPLRIQGIKFTSLEKRVHAALDKVCLLEKQELLPIHLSGGEQQRVGIARAIVHKPALLIADEPTGNLDPDLAVEMMSLFEAFNRAGVTVLIATHDLGLIARMKHRMLTLKGGHLC